MSNLIPREFRPPVTPPKTRDVQDTADALDMARIALMASTLYKELDSRGFGPCQPLVIATMPEIARKVFTDGH